MSEYQYYEFQTVDRPLSQREMAALRKLSTRATISPTRFVNVYNVYNFGNFRGAPSELMEKYFDGFVYLANWGSREFMVRLPQRLLTLETAEHYCSCEWVTARAAGADLILDFNTYDEEQAGWILEQEVESWLTELLPLRAELATGDLRGLYLGWLLCVQGGLIDDDVIEPPVPPGIGNLSAALRTFADFFWLDDALIEIAAERSAALDPIEPTPEHWQRWIQDLPSEEKDTLLVRLMTEDDPHLRAEIIQRFQQSMPARSDSETTGSADRRTVGQLIAAAEQLAELKRREAAEREARERARLAEEQARARAAYLDGLIGHEEETWSRVETLISDKRPPDYPQAATLLRDLRDLAQRTRQSEQFTRRLEDLRARHARKSSLLKRLKGAGL